MGTILSIDYGLKRIGLAISDPNRSFALPYKTITNDNIDNIISCLKNIIKEKDIDLIIIGMPLNMDNSKGFMAENVENFTLKIKEEIPVEIKVIDERLSSFEAEDNLKKINIKSRKIKKIIDAEAARIILENYMEEVNKN